MINLIDKYENISIKRNRIFLVFSLSFILCPFIFCLFLIKDCIYSKMVSDFSRTFVLIVLLPILIISIYGLIITLKRLVDKRPGLIINEKGINDLIKGIFYKWQDIDYFNIPRIGSRAICEVHVVYYREYIDKNIRGFKKIYLLWHLKLYRVFLNGLWSNYPLFIHTWLLNIKPEELKDLLELKRYEYKCLIANNENLKFE